MIAHPLLEDPCLLHTLTAPTFLLVLVLVEALEDSLYQPGGKFGRVGIWAL